MCTSLCSSVPLSLTLPTPTPTIVCLSVWLAVSRSLCLCLSVRPSVCPPVRLSVCLSLAHTLPLYIYICSIVVLIRVCPNATVLEY